MRHYYFAPLPIFSISMFLLSILTLHLCPFSASVCFSYLYLLCTFAHFQHQYVSLIYTYFAPLPIFSISMFLLSILTLHLCPFSASVCFSYLYLLCTFAHFQHQYVSPIYTCFAPLPIFSISMFLLSILTLHLCPFSASVCFFYLYLLCTFAHFQHQYVSPIYTYFAPLPIFSISMFLLSILTLHLCPFSASVCFSYLYLLCTFAHFQHQYVSSIYTYFAPLPIFSISMFLLSILTLHLCPFSASVCFFYLYLLCTFAHFQHQYVSPIYTYFAPSTFFSI